MYNFIRSLLFLLPAETAHTVTLRLFKLLHLVPGFGVLVRSLYSTKSSEPIELAGLKFSNHVGLAAGFDKDAKYIRELANLGFGCIEVGTVTPKPQAGNPKPRLFRLKKDDAIINRMGFNNGGLKEMISRLDRLDKRVRDRIILGGNIGKNKVTPNEEAVNDYTTCLRALKPHVDYFTVNVSSPNTPGLRELQKKENLSVLLKGIREANEEILPAKPIFLKISPDESLEQIDDILEVIVSEGLSGIITTNTTVSRDGLRTDQTKLDEIGNGGLSGKPVFEKSTEVVRYIHRKTNGQLPIIAVGGIDSPQTAQEKMKAGASLVQVYTGFIYEGPALIRQIARSLLY